MKTSAPVGDPSWIATLCGMPASWLSNSIWNGVSAGALQLGLVVGDVLRDQRQRAPAGGLTARRVDPPDGAVAAGPAMRWPRRSCCWSQASKSAGGERVDVEEHHPVAGAAQLGALAAERLAGVARP